MSCKRKEEGGQWDEHVDGDSGKEGEIKKMDEKKGAGQNNDKRKQT